MKEKSIKKIRCRRALGKIIKDMGGLIQRIQFELKNYNNENNTEQEEGEVNVEKYEKRIKMDENKSIL